MLARQPMNLNTLAENFDISRPAISKQIKILSECGLIDIEQRGRERYCTARIDRLKEVTDWAEKMRSFWNKKLDDLENFLADNADKGPIKRFYAGTGETE